MVHEGGESERGNFKATQAVFGSALVLNNAWRAGRKPAAVVYHCSSLSGLGDLEYNGGESLGRERGITRKGVLSG